MRRLSLVIALALGLSPAAAAAQTAADTWPTRQPIRVVVPLTAGSATDAVARVVFEQVGRQIGQTIIIENRVGAAQTIGAAAVAKAEPDGYTVLVNSSSHTVFPSTFTSLPFSVTRDFSAVTPLANIPTVMVIAPSKGFKTTQDFVAAAKAEPGAMTYGSGGVGNSTHFAAERFRLAAGFTGVHVPFKGAPEALTEVMTGRVDFYFSPVPPALALIRDGRLQALAVSSARRSSVLPDVPTTAESGLADSTYEFWVGVFVPSATPRAIVDRLYREIRAALEMPAVRDKLGTLGADPMPLSPVEFDDYVRREIDTNAALVKAAGIKAN